MVGSFTQLRKERPVSTHTESRIRGALRGLASTLLAGVALFPLSGCGTATPRQAADTDRLHVVASANQWGSMAAELGGELVTATSIMTGTGVEAHDYEPTSQDIATLADADIIVVNGAGYDSWASKAAGNTNTPLVDAAESAGVSDGDNPHVWFSGNARAAAADAITAAYGKADPSNKDMFEQLNDQWHEREAQLESDIRQARENGTEGLRCAATEPVARYLLEDLGLTDATPEGYAQASANGSEPTPADLKAFTDALHDGAIDLLVVNVQESSSVTERITQSARAADVPVVDVTEQMPETYGSLTDWVAALAKALAGTTR